ncbi:MAG: Txe/YoeB family addiction module toxin [Micrococcales bacterium]|nr:Txe/YoeB family addiction module toxin [Micrococcales bacterium]MCL2668753.1 Txe/YoeB family addiction module toxin [Micrococcales bacterium]
MPDFRFLDGGWDDYIWWQAQDRRTLRKINNLLRDIARDPESGVGEPEELRGDLAGWWSRRITQTDRLVYRVEDGQVVVIACLGHYDN